MDEKYCTHCGIKKSIDDFWFNKKLQRYHSNCRTCKYQKNKTYENVSKEKKAEYDKTYREKHKDTLKDRKREEYLKNKTKYIQRQLKYQQSKEGKLKHNIRTRIWNAVKRKSNSSKDLLGCDIVFYMEYIEYLFDDKMTWDNYGDYWQIDHVQPLHTFDLDDMVSQKEAFNWKNTRPLSKYDNLSKKRNTKDEIDKHKAIVENFLVATSSNCGDTLIV